MEALFMEFEAKTGLGGTGLARCHAYFIFCLMFVCRSDFIVALNANLSEEQAKKNRQLNEARLMVRSTNVYHRKHGIPTPAELAEPGFKERYDVALKGEQTYWIAQCMRWFDVVAWKKGQRELEEVHSSQERAKRQAESNKRKREELVKSCHALNLKLWDPKDRSFGDGRARYAREGGSSRADAEVVTEANVEAYLATSEGDTLMKKLKIKKVGDEGGLRERLEHQGRLLQAERNSVARLTAAVRDVQGTGMAIISCLKATKSPIEIQDEWLRAFDRNQPAESPLRPTVPVAGRSQASTLCGSAAGGSTISRLTYGGAAASETAETQDFAFGEDEAEESQNSQTV
jgi:hypothetical protein